MKAEDFRAELENQLTWRQDELRFFSNRLAGISREDERDQYRRALVLLLYAHFEGFCKSALLTYAKVVNDASLSCDNAIPAIAAAGMEPVFSALFSSDSKSKIFKNSLPDDAKLHRFSRQIDFMEQLADFLRRTVQITDEVVDTESNLKPIVLRKNLFRLGLRHDLFAQHEGAINNLLNRRNNIAHGADRSGITEKEYTELTSAVADTMSVVTTELTQAVAAERYKQPTPTIP